MAQILNFAPRPSPEASDMALLCMCGSDHFFLLQNGEMECTSCGFVVPGKWDFDETVLDAEIHEPEGK